MNAQCMRLVCTEREKEKEIEIEKEKECLL